MDGTQFVEIAITALVFAVVGGILVAGALRLLDPSVRHRVSGSLSVLILVLGTLGMATIAVALVLGTSVEPLAISAVGLLLAMMSAYFVWKARGPSPP